RPELRQSVVFGRHDLTRDAPISRIDLAVCRNTLVYLNTEAQVQVVSRFHSALVEDGLLVLGRTEAPAGLAEQFSPLEGAAGIYRKVGGDRRVSVRFGETVHQKLAGVDHLRGEVFVTGPVAQLVMTADGMVALINQAAEVLLGVSSRDIGRPFA